MKPHTCLSKAGVFLCMAQIRSKIAFVGIARSEKPDTSSDIKNIILKRRIKHLWGNILELTVSEEKQIRS